MRNNNKEMYKEMYKEIYKKEHKKQAQQEAARKMLLKGKYSIEEIADIQDLTVEEVHELEAGLLQKV